MNNFKKIVAMVMAGFVMLAFAGCSKKNSKKSSKKNSDVSVKVGETVTFGIYGGKKIEWIVLDTGENGALLLAKEGLDVKQMDDETGQVENIWEDCDLHGWLNGEFYETSFSDEEKKQINQTTVKFEKSPTEYSFSREGQDTEDYVFLLSYTEANTYFHSEEAMTCPPSATATANSDFVGNKGNCRWWLRTNAAYKNSYLFVNDYGEINVNKGASCYEEDICVRPAMWVSI